MAFVIGWNLILEYVIGTASVARGYSGYMDSLLNHTIETHFREWMPLGVSWLSTYPDVFALAITLFLAGMLAIGVKESTRFNNVFTLVNLLVVVYVVIVGAFKADIRNWQLKPEDIPRNDTGVGGFFPYGVGGMLNGAASCFYAFVGFDCIATMGEEVRNPRRAIPIGIVVSLTIVFLAYFGVSVIETLVWPYWDQNVSAPLPYVFDRAGWPVAKWVVSIGALAGLSTSLLGGMFPLPRVLYAMGSDGLIFRFLAIVHPRLKTPLLATLLSGVFAGTMAMIFNVEELANMMSIGTLLAYSLVAVSVLMLRYEVPSQSHGETGTLDNDAMELKPRSSFTTMFNSDGLQSPTMETSYLVKILTLVLGALFCTLNGILVFAEGPFFNGDLPVVIPFAGVALLAVLCIIVISRQPSASTESLSFAVPLVPYIPMFNMFVNLYLMMRLPPSTWVRFVVWMVLGFLIYFGYGIFNSSQRKPSPPFLRDAASVDSVLSSDNQSDGVAGGTE
uniref:Putative cationic amino acid transport permease n=1 Tax=Ixodes ricinus TaxID=34613 RepID=V5I3J9_IXORI